jgi:intracellular septation protein
MTATPKPQLNPFLKLALDLGPLLLFFFANSHYGIFTATATFMVAILAAMAVSYVLTRHFPIMTVVTAIVVVVFGGLTLILHDAGLSSTNHCSASCSIRSFTSPRKAGAN